MFHFILVSPLYTTNMLNIKMTMADTNWSICINCEHEFKGKYYIQAIYLGTLKTIKLIRKLSILFFLDNIVFHS